MAKPADLPRVLCDACPAYATVDLVETHPDNDQAYFVVRCHGETIIAAVGGESRLAKARGGPDRPFLLRELGVVAVAGVRPREARRPDTRIKPASPGKPSQLM